MSSEGLPACRVKLSELDFSDIYGQTFTYVKYSFGIFPISTGDLRILRGSLLPRNSLAIWVIISAYKIEILSNVYDSVELRERFLERLAILKLIQIFNKYWDLSPYGQYSTTRR